MIAKWYVVLLGLTIASQHSIAEEFKSAAGKYSITFKGTPTVSSMDVNTPDGLVTINYALFEPSPELAYSSNYMDLAPKVAQEKPQDVLSRTVFNSQGPLGKILEEKDITHGASKIPGKEFLIDRQGTFMRGRVFLRGTRQYMVMFASKNKETAMAAEATFFLATFQIHE